MKIEKLLIILGIAGLAGVLLFGTMPGEFETPEYKNQETITVREVILYETHDRDKKPLKWISKGSPVTMTGSLYGEPGEAYYLFAQVVMPDDTSGWVPLSSLELPISKALKFD